MICPTMRRESEENGIRKTLIRSVQREAPIVGLYEALEGDKGRALAVGALLQRGRRS